jgi:hypothetical protein
MYTGNIGAELLDWISTLEPGFALLVALPFVVAMAGLAADPGPAGEGDARVSNAERIGVPAGIGTALALLAAATD